LLWRYDAEMGSRNRSPATLFGSGFKFLEKFGFGAGSGFLVFGAGFGVNFSDSAHLCRKLVTRFGGIGRV